MADVSALEHRIALLLDCGPTLNAKRKAAQIMDLFRTHLASDEVVERAARAVCRDAKTGQCAAICLSDMSIRTTNGQCQYAKRVFGRQMRAALAAIME